MRIQDCLGVVAGGVSTAIEFFMWPVGFMLFTTTVPRLFGVQAVQHLTSAWYRELTRQIFLNYCLLAFSWALVSHLTAYIIDMRDWAQHDYDRQNWRPPMAFAKSAQAVDSRFSTYQMMMLYYPTVILALCLAVTINILGLLGYIQINIGIEI